MQAGADGEMAISRCAELAGLSRAWPVAHKRCSWSDSAHPHPPCLVCISFLSLLPSLPGFVWCKLWALSLPFLPLTFLLAPGLLTGAPYCTSVHWCWSPRVIQPASKSVNLCPPSAAASTCSPFLLSPRFPSRSPRLRSLPRSPSRPSPSAPSSAMTPTASAPRCSRLPLPARFRRGSSRLSGQRTHQ